MALPIGQKLVKSGSTWARLCGTHIFGTAGWIYTIRSSMELSRPVVVQHQGHLTLTLDFQGKILKMLYFRNGRANSHIRHSRAGRALLRWRKECGRLWVLLGSTVHMVQAGPHAQSGMCIDSYLFLPEISSFVITCTYRFTTDDNHLQNSTILSSVICVIQVISSHYINPTLIFFSELDPGIIWKFCIIRLQ